jgi:hypothetical protein
MSKDVITRRDFLRKAGYATLAIATTGCGIRLPEELTPTSNQKQNNKIAPQPEVKSDKKAKVVLVRHPDAIDAQGRINPKVILKMLDDAVSTLFDKKDCIDAWKGIVRPNDIVGIKSNVWYYLPTPREIEQAIKKRLIDAGVGERNIGIDDRGVLRNRIFRNCTALINVRPLRTHHWSGVGGCIKNYIPFVSFPLRYHPNACANLAKIWSLPIVKGKTRLNILILLNPLFHGIGPHHFQRKYTWQYKGILVGTDPVAVDAVGLQILCAKRKAYFGKEIPLSTPPHHILFAETKHKLGISNLANIELVKLGWSEGILIS